MVMRWRNAAFLTKAESTEGVFTSPSASTDAVLVENPAISYSPQNVETDEVTGSLDGRGPIVGGMQCQLTFRVYLKGQGRAGVAPEIADILKACGLAETVTVTDQTGTTFAITGGNTITDSGNGLAVLTIGTAIYTFGWTNAGNNDRELIVTASAAGSITVTNPDGTAPNLTNEAAGASVTIRRGVAAVAATAGAAAQITAQAPWSNAADAYTYLPVWLTGNPATPALSAVHAYSAARVAQLCDTFSPVLSGTTKASIPAHVLYKPQSGVIPSNSCELYADGVVYRFTGMRGDLTATLNAAGASWVDVTLSGLFQAKADAAVPAAVYDASRPGTFRASRMSVNAQVCQLRTFSLGLGNSMAFPADPNSQEGFGAPQIMRRRIAGTFDPYATTVATRDLFQAFRNGTEMPLHARILGGTGALAGNRVALTVPKAFYESYQPTDDQGMSVEAIGYFARGQDTGFGLVFF